MRSSYIEALGRMKLKLNERQTNDLHVRPDTGISKLSCYIIMLHTDTKQTTNATVWLPFTNKRFCHVLSHADLMLKFVNDFLLFTPNVKRA